MKTDGDKDGSAGEMELFEGWILIPNPNGDGTYLNLKAPLEEYPEGTLYISKKGGPV